VLPEIAIGRHIEILLQKPPLRGLKFDLSKAQVAGPRDARVQLVVFSDFQCQYCVKLAPVLEKVRAEFPAEVLVAYRYYPLDANPRSRPAAIAAQCAAEQGAFWKYHDRLFAAPGDLSDKRLTELAGELGLDPAKFEMCRQSDPAKQAVEASYTDAVQLGIEGAPALFLNGDLIGGYVEYEALAKRIRAALAPK
jgi:protein-disulfide isomerase